MKCRPPNRGFGSSVVALAAICLAWPGRIAGEDTTMRVVQDAGTVSMVLDGRPVLQYRATDVPFKPYVKELYTPGGIQILRDLVPDHKHHHGLMFAIAADGVDFWSELKTCGRQVSAGLENVKSSAQNGNASASFTQHLVWMSPDDKEELREHRTLELHRVKVAGGDATLLTWRSRLETPPGKDSVKLTGSHYFGLGMRFVTSMDAEGRFTNSEGAEGPLVRGSERVTPAKWCAYTSTAGGKPVTVAMFDSPKNSRPARFFTMRPFAYLSATLNLWKEPMVLKAGEPLDLCYGVALWDGQTEPAGVAELYRKWAAGGTP